MLEDISAKAKALVHAAQQAGATASDAAVSLTQSIAVSVREGKVENTNANESDTLSLRVFVGQKVASVSATAADDPNEIASRAVAMANVSPEDPFATIVDADRIAHSWPELDLLDNAEPSASVLTELALAMESTALSVKGVTKSSSASASRGKRGMVLATSEGFIGAYERSGFGLSTAVIAGEGTSMERDFAYHSATYFDDLKAPEHIGQEAGERVVQRLGAIKPKTGSAAIVFDPRVARGLAGHIASAVNGASVARQTSFLRNKMNAQILPDNAQIIDKAHKMRGLASRPFDGEGVSVDAITLVENGVLKNWLLSHSIAKQLGLKTNGRGSRSGSSVSPSTTNFTLTGGVIAPDQLIKDIGDGLYITEVFGQGVNLVTGEYSRGASGFIIRDGALAEPISEFTIASNLEAMFATAILANDCDENYSTAAPTIAVPQMMVAGA